jgi:hypothetical protein
LLGDNEALFDGTGAEALREVHAHCSSAAIPGSIPPVLNCLARATNMMGELIGSELWFSNALHQYFGAGYEVVSVRGGELTKLDLATHIFWNCQLDGGEHLLRPQRVLRSYYWGEQLVVRTTDVVLSETPNRLKIQSHDIHVVTAPGIRPGGEIDYAAIPRRSFTAPLTASHTLLHAGGSPLGIAHTLRSDDVATEEWETDELVMPDALFDDIVRTILTSGLRSV